MTKITNEANEYTVDIDNGADSPATLETSALSTIRICREQATVGGKLVVSVLEIAPDGKGKRNFAFVLGEPSLTASGMPTMPEEHSTTNTVTTAVAATTNAPSTKEENPLKK